MAQYPIVIHDIESSPPPLPATLDVLQRHFASPVAAEMRPLRNPHHEPKVSTEVMARAREAAVLIPLCERADGLAMLVTRRHRDIRFAGHICFPGGGRDAADATLRDTMLRECAEEIGLAPGAVAVLGRMGDYFTQTGYRIAPFVGVLAEPVTLRANPDEVEEIIEVPFAKVLRPDSYRLERHRPGRGHYAFRHGSARIAGPTVSLMIGLYEELLRSQPAAGS